MGLSLYQHNMEAYQSLSLMLERTGKACVVHPTGTGKSFIGFKLCEDHPDQRICWLSPSEYIFRTQVENLRESLKKARSIPAASLDSAGQPAHSRGEAERNCGCPYENVVFYTYARLACMTEQEIASIAPEYIILDEFHRCGADVWGSGIQRLLAMYPDAGIAGLSATAVRYLDNQRDMADELFDGNIAREVYSDTP